MKKSKAQLIKEITKLGNTLNDIVNYLKAIDSLVQLQNQAESETDAILEATMCIGFTNLPPKYCVQLDETESEVIEGADYNDIAPPPEIKFLQNGMMMMRPSEPLPPSTERFIDLKITASAFLYISGNLRNMLQAQYDELENELINLTNKLNETTKCTRIIKYVEEGTDRTFIHHQYPYSTD